MKTCTITPDTHGPVSLAPAPHTGAPAGTTTGAPADPDALAYDVAEHGIDACEPAIEEVVKTARRQGMSSVVLDVLGDRGAASVARERALGRLLTDLSLRRPSAGGWAA